MTDFASLGISVDSRPVAEGTKALDAFAASASAVEPKVAGATKAIEGMAESTISVWRRGGDATKSVEALGDATARTGQRAAVSNGQMSDTAKIMQMQADQARATAQAQVVLGGSTDKLTLGQQFFIDKLRDQVAVLGMSRSQLLAYQAAQLGVTAQTQALIDKMKAYEDATKAAAEAAKAAAAAKDQQAQSGITLSNVLGVLASAYAALKVAEYIKEAALMAARYETLGVVMQVVGRTAGYTKTQMDTASQAIAAQGITLIESRESAVKLVQAHVDLSHATGLARIAQDAAVIGHLNSSDAFDRLVNGISRGNVLILRNIGLNVNFQTGYRETAKELNKTVAELTENERVQSRVNTVMARGTDIAGTYAAAMDTASKQITSMQRYVSDLKTVIGETFTEALTVSVMALTSQLKGANGEISEMSKNGQLQEWGHSLTEVFVGVANAIDNIMTGAKMAGNWLGHKTAESDINKKYMGLQMDAPDLDSPSAQRAQTVRIEKERQAAILKEQSDYENAQITLGGLADRFQIAFDARSAVILEKKKAEAAAKLKVDTDYFNATKAIFGAAEGKGEAAAREAQKKFVELYKSVYVGTPTYRDTEGKPVKPKVDRVESTELADYIKQQDGIAAAAKNKYANLGKLDDMYHKAGELSDLQYYANLRSYAEKTAAAQVESYDKDIVKLKAYHNSTEAEAAKNNKTLHEIEAKRTAAIDQGNVERKQQEVSERLRRDAIVQASTDAATKEIASINAQVAAVEMQIRTYNMLPAAKTAVAIADLEEQNAALAGFDAGEKTIELNNQKIESLKRLKAVQATATAQEAGTDVAKAKELLDILTAVDAATKQAAQGMTESFGRVGTAIGSLTTALSGYAVQQQAIAAQLASVKADPRNGPDKVAAAEIAASRSSAQAQIRNYGDLAAAGKNFFKENTAGYKVMQGAEKAFRAYEMAMAVESMVKKIFFKETEVAANIALNTTKIGGEAAASAASTGLAATEASAWGITAVVKAIASLPFPANLAAGAATLAAVVAIGAKMFGGVGGGVDIAKERQTATGTGSVLGDSSAKSESIAHSLAIMEKNSGLGLAQGASMVGSLREIVQGIGGLGSLLVRNSGVTGAMASDSKGAAASFGSSTLGVALAGGVVGLVLDKITGGLVGKLVGGVLGSIFGGKTTTLDTGVTVGKTSLAGIAAGGVTASQYTDTKTDGGWFSSDKYNTALTGLGAEANSQISQITLGLRDTVKADATALGLGGDEFAAKLNSFVVGLDVSLKGLSGDDLQKALETAFSKLGDDMARFGVAGLEQYQAVGEGYLETLARVANDYLQVSDVLAVLGKSFNVTGLAAVSLSEGLIASAGGLDKLTSGTSFFVQNFLTEAEQMAPITKSVQSAMAALGQSGVTTNEQFKALVLGLDLSTAAGQSMYGQLIALAEPFKKSADYAAELAAATGDYAAAAKTASEIASEHKDLLQQLNELTKTDVELLTLQRAAISDVNKSLFDQVQAAKAVTTAKDALSKAYQTEAAAAQTAIDKSKSWVTTLNGLNGNLAMGNLSTLTPEQKYAEARAQFERTLASANAGDATAQGGLSAAEQAFLTASQVVNASDAKYASDYARVLAANNDAVKWASAQVDVAQASLDALTAQVSGLITINDSVLTVAQAIANLQVAMGGAASLGVKFDGSHAGGLVDVPFDGYMAQTHRGGAIADAPAMSAMRRYFGGAPSQGGGNTDALVAEVKMLREEIKGLRVDQDKQTGDLIQATFQSNDQNAKTVVAGVDKSAKASIWANKNEVVYG